MSKLNLLESLSQSMGKICLMVAGLSCSLLSTPVDAATLGENLVINGNVEQGKADAIGNAVGADIPVIPGWNSSGGFSVLRYDATGFEFVNPRGQTVFAGRFPNFNNPGPSSRGLNMFYGGAERGSSFASQLIDVADLASTIDSGRGSFKLSGWLGGYEDQQDNVLLNVTFLNQDRQSLGNASIASLTPAQRNNTTGLFYQSVDEFVPVGTRQINVVLNMNYTAGRVNDGYADNLSLVITKVPEPSMSEVLLVGAASVAWGLRRNRRM